MFNYDKNYTELCIENYFFEKNHSTFSKQLTHILVKFRTFETFRPVKIKLKVEPIKPKKRVGLSACDERFFYGFQLRF